MNKKLLAAVAATTALSVMSGCSTNPNKTAEEREQEKNILTVAAGIGGILAANALGVDNNVGKVAVGAITGITARAVYDEVYADTANDPNTNVEAVKIGDQEYIQVNVQNVNFRSGSADLEPYELTRLTPVINALNKHPNTRVYIEGHTDSDGSKAYNQQLSENRAKGVALHLMRNGIASNRITTYGYGEERPIASNATPEGKRQNRRVTFLISEI
ncbi:OmpA family protein [Thiomicrorhabdus sp. ZW0627]|uniref:OmpA family protein n=1 Tax=Thiomicrorhabdus sp. ZW0627 TaxID=3039774 RepID=UPI0024373892|nr:OmpA family protein [Thiomicrorhabdus sp. ZW0627]MDG6773586.1 OmpA family protein [Thiomicrorhabdus sp. ZW0627]